MEGKGSYIQLNDVFVFFWLRLWIDNLTLNSPFPSYVYRYVL